MRPLILLIFLCISACGPSQEEVQQQKRLIEMQEVASRYFGNEVKAGTFGVWLVDSVSTRTLGKTNIVEITLDVPTAQAKEIMSRPSAGQFRAVGWNACPRSISPMWAPFKNGDILYIQARYEGRIFIDVDCTRWRLN